MRPPDTQEGGGGPRRAVPRGVASGDGSAWEDASFEVERPLDVLPERVVYSEDEDDTEGPAEAVSPGSTSHMAAASVAQRPHTSPVPLASSVEIAAEEVRAVDAARHHLQRLARRRQRHGTVAWMRRSLSTLPVCIIDLETTGGRHDRDEILEVGAVLLRGGECVREFSSLVDPQRPISAAAHRVHRIGSADVVGAPRVHELLPWIRELAAHRVLLFHNAGFDLGFLQRAFEENGQEPLHQPVIDTVVVSRRLMRGRCGLGSLGQRLGIDLPHAHRALADARLTAQVWLRLRDHLLAAGASTLGEVPGVVGRASRRRRRDRAPHRELLQTLHDAIRAARGLELAYRAVPGMEPHVLHVRPVRLLHNRACRMFDLERHVWCDLWLDRIDFCRPADPPGDDACAGSEHRV